MNATAKKATGPDAEIAALDAQLVEVDVRKAALAAALAEEEIKLDGLKRAFDAEPTDALYAQFAAGEETLRRLAAKTASLAKLEDRRTTALRERRTAAQAARLEQAEAEARAELAAMDGEIVEIALRLSTKITRRMKAEGDLFGVIGRLDHMGAVMSRARNVAFDERALVLAFLERFKKEAERPMPFGSQAWRTFELPIPYITPSPEVAALKADDDEAS